MATKQGDSIVLEEEIDPNYQPTSDEIAEYAKWLGIDLVEDADLLWIAREGLKVRPPLARTAATALPAPTAPTAPCRRMPTPC